MSINERDPRRAIYSRLPEMKNGLLVTGQDGVMLRCMLRIFYPLIIIHHRSWFVTIHKVKGLIKLLAYPCILMQNAHTHGAVGLKL